MMNLRTDSVCKNMDGAKDFLYCSVATLEHTVKLNKKFKVYTEEHENNINKKIKEIQKIIDEL